MSEQMHNKEPESVRFPGDLAAKDREIAALKTTLAKPTIIIGQPTMDRLRAGDAVELDAVTLIPASDLHSHP